MKKSDEIHITINVNSVWTSNNTNIGDTMEKEIGRRKIESMLRNPKESHIKSIQKYIELWNKRWGN